MGVVAMGLFTSPARQQEKQAAKHWVRQGLVLDFDVLEIMSATGPLPRHQWPGRQLLLKFAPAEDPSAVLLIGGM